MAHCATVLGHPLPADLVALLRETDGIEDEYGDGLVWPTENVASTNQSLREDSAFPALYMPFAPLLFFADAGNGDLFALLATIDRPDVFAWNHEN
ncbi:SMI1/KNR4 family protein, partial [Streptomyces sp. DT225]